MCHPLAGRNILRMSGVMAKGLARRLLQWRQLTVAAPRVLMGVQAAAWVRQAVGSPSSQLCTMHTAAHHGCTGEQCTLLPRLALVRQAPTPAAMLNPVPELHTCTLTAVLAQRLVLAVHRVAACRGRQLQQLR